MPAVLHEVTSRYVLEDVQPLCWECLQTRPRPRRCFIALPSPALSFRLQFHGRALSASSAAVLGPENPQASYRAVGSDVQLRKTRLIMSHQSQNQPVFGVLVLFCCGTCDKLTTKSNHHPNCTKPKHQNKRQHTPPTNPICTTTPTRGTELQTPPTHGRTVLCTDTTVKILPAHPTGCHRARSRNSISFSTFSSFADHDLVHETAIVTNPARTCRLIGGADRLAGVVNRPTGAVVKHREGCGVRDRGGDRLRRRLAVGAGGAANHKLLHGPEIGLRVPKGPISRSHPTGKLQPATKRGATDIVDPQNVAWCDAGSRSTNGGVHHSFQVRWAARKPKPRAGFGDAGARRPPLLLVG